MNEGEAFTFACERSSDSLPIWIWASAEEDFNLSKILQKMVKKCYEIKLKNKFIIEKHPKPLQHSGKKQNLFKPFEKYDMIYDVTHCDVMWYTLTLLLKN